MKIDSDYYIFRFKENDIIVEYKDDNTRISLKDLKFELVGIAPEDGNFTVRIITKNGLYKFKENISKDLEVIGFKFKNLKDAIEVQSHIINKMILDKK